MFEEEKIIMLEGYVPADLSDWCLLWSYYLKNMKETHRIAFNHTIHAYWGVRQTFEKDGVLQRLRCLSRYANIPPTKIWRCPFNVLRECLITTGCVYIWCRFSFENTCILICWIDFNTRDLDFLLAAVIILVVSTDFIPRRAQQLVSTVQHIRS
jgi:hypothetical protein